MAEHGGKRQGAGRKLGAATKRTREIADKASAEGLTPLEYMLQILRDEDKTLESRFEAAKAAAPYVHPKLASVEHKGDPDNPVAFARVERIIVDPSEDPDTKD